MPPKSCSTRRRSPDEGRSPCLARDILVRVIVHVLECLARADLFEGLFLDLTNALAGQAHDLADFLEGLESGEPVRPNFRDALETQRICDAVLKSAKTEAWEKVEV